MRLLERLAALAAPYDCSLCGREGELVCDFCLPDLALADVSRCLYCRRPVGRQLCVPCSNRHGLDELNVLYRYEGAVRRLLVGLKYEGKKSAAKVLSPTLSVMAHGADIVTAVPSSSSRARKRGYHQAELLAKALAGSPLPYRRLLSASRARSQVGLSGDERRSAVSRFFPVAELTGQTVLLVDDVFTTGATMAACAQALKTAGAGKVIGLAVGVSQLETNLPEPV